MKETFEALGILEPLSNGLKKQGITVPTEIQKRVIPFALEKLDIIGQSETGSGKTLAYLLPILQKIDVSKREIQALILTPTHELAIQIQRVIEDLAKDTQLPFLSAPIIGNVNIARQIEKLKEKPQIVVGSAGRILELIKKKKLTAHTIKTIVMDEGDRLLDRDNMECVKAIIKSTLKERHLMLFSATLSNEIITVAKELMKNPEIVKIEEQNKVATTIDHYYFLTEQRDKIEVLRKLVHSVNPKRAIVFINKSDSIEITTSKLTFHGLKAEGIHGTSIKQDRKKAMEDFKSGKINLLVASDIAARGLDIKEVTHIFNLDLPEDPIYYLHRVGRTGRAGASGVAISIVTERELPLIKAYENKYKIQIIRKDIFKGKFIDAPIKNKETTVSFKKDTSQPVKTPTFYEKIKKNKNKKK